MFAFVHFNSALDCHTRNMVRHCQVQWTLLYPSGILDAHLYFIQLDLMDKYIYTMTSSGIQEFKISKYELIESMS